MIYRKRIYTEDSEVTEGTEKRDRRERVDSRLGPGYVAEKGRALRSSG
jgi:hypothetical protein